MTSLPPGCSGSPCILLVLDRLVDPISFGTALNHYVQDNEVRLRKWWSITELIVLDVMMKVLFRRIWGQPGDQHQEEYRDYRSIRWYDVID